jgi:hypothetical protein
MIVDWMIIASNSEFRAMDSRLDLLPFASTKLSDIKFRVQSGLFSTSKFTLWPGYRGRKQIEELASCSVVHLGYAYGYGYAKE